MTAVVRRELKLGAKKAPNKQLLAVLGVVMLLAVVFKGLPSLVGGGGAVAPFNPAAVLHLHKATPGASVPAGTATGSAPQSNRDPFGPPPGYAAGH